MIILVVPRTARGRLIAVILTLLFGFVATRLGLAAHYGPGPYR